MAALNLTAPRDLNNTPVNDPLGMYKISDQDPAGDPQYYGYLAHDGSYYIQKIDVAGNAFRYYAGKDNYAAQWTNRASLPYDYFDAIF